MLEFHLRSEKEGITEDLLQKGAVGSGVKGKDHGWGREGQKRSALRWRDRLEQGL